MHLSVKTRSALLAGITGLALCAALVLALKHGLTLPEIDKQDHGWVVWESTSGEPVPDKFGYLLFATGDSRAYLDKELRTSPRPWTSATFNGYEEYGLPYVASRFEDGTECYVDAATLSLHPRADEDIAAQMSAIVRRFALRTDGMRLRSIAYQRISEALDSEVWLVVKWDRLKETFVYQTTNNRLVPVRVYREGP